MKAIGNFTSTEGRQCTEMLDGEWTSLSMALVRSDIESYQIFSEFLEGNELEEGDRWFDIEEDEEGRLFATTGTVDLDYYIEVSE